MSSLSRQLSSISCAGRRPAPSFTEIRLVLLGKTGSGKSATANSILGRKIFDSKVSSSSGTQRCRRASGEFRGRHLTLLDTPGLLDTSQTPQEVQKELRRSVSLLYPGPHVFLLVIQIGRFTQEEKEAVQQIKQAMGSPALRFSVVVFTRGDHLEEGASVKQCLIDECKDLAELIEECGGRYCVFSNYSSKNKEQVSELLALVDNMMHNNEGSYYTIKILQKAEEDLTQELQEERQLLKEKEELVKRKQEAEIKEWYEKELKIVQQKSLMEIEELKMKQELEKQSAEKLMRDQEEALRRQMEEHERIEKERKIEEMVRLMAICREEEEKRDLLQEKLDNVTKTLEDQAESGEKIRRAMEEQIRKERMENQRREREKELQQREKEQAIRQREEMKREVLQKELDRLMEEQSQKETERKKHMEDVLRREREKNQRERDIQMENQKAEKQRAEALRQELIILKMKIGQQKKIEESLKKQLEENQRREREKDKKEIAELKKQHEKKCPEATKKKPAEKHSTMTMAVGYLQEMGLVGLNATLETIGAPCCIQ